jgi:hypothetical protein
LELLLYAPRSVCGSRPSGSRAAGSPGSASPSRASGRCAAPATGRYPRGRGRAACSRAACRSSSRPRCPPPRSRLATPREERTPRLLAAALFPPELLRAPAARVDEALAGFAPVTLAALALPPARLLPLLRAAVGALEQRERAADARAPAPLRAYRAALRAGLLRVARDAGIPSEHVLPLGRPVDAERPSWCPVCLDEFRPGYRFCPGCRAETVRYAGPAPS